MHCRSREMTWASDWLSLFNVPYIELRFKGADSRITANNLDSNSK